MNAHSTIKGLSLRAKLKFYATARRELEEIEIERKNFHYVYGSVKGSMLEYPYLLQSIPVTGDSTEPKNFKEARKRELLDMCMEVDQFLYGVQDPFIGFLLRLRYVEELSWDTVAARAGGGNTEGSVKKSVYRFLEKAKVVPNVPN